MSSEHAVAPKPDDVIVINPAERPVPVSGTVAASKQNWEYLVMARPPMRNPNDVSSLVEDVQKKLTELGNQGWEFEGDNFGLFIFKRPR